MKRYNFELAQAFHKTDIGLDGIIRSLGGEPIPRHKETIVWYENGSISSYNIEGELGQRSIPDKNNMVKVEIGTTVNRLLSSAFNTCIKLISVAIPDSVTSIGSGAFISCTNLTSVLIGSGVKSIDSLVFARCPNLTSIIINPKNPVYDSRNNCNAIIKTNTNELVAGCKSTTIPSSVTKIGDLAFYLCLGLTTITIPNGVTSIGHTAFRECTDLISIEISSDITEIGSTAFAYCTKLKSIKIMNTTASTIFMSSSPFGSSDADYTGRDTYSTGNNVLKVPRNATGYNTSYWLDPLQNDSKCGFHIEYLD